MFHLKVDVSHCCLNKVEEMIKSSNGQSKSQILANNTGANIRKKTFQHVTEDFDSLMQTNLASMCELSELFHSLLKGKDKNKKCTSSIVNVGSVAGSSSLKSGTIYAATKAAMSQLTANLACEWASDGIRVNCAMFDTCAFLFSKNLKGVFFFTNH